MKTRMNKLAVLVIIAAMVMFTGVAMAQHAGLSGVYAVNGSSNCVISPAGFTNLVPNVSTLWLTATTFYEGVYTFYPYGYGTFRSLGHFNNQYGPYQVSGHQQALGIAGQRAQTTTSLTLWRKMAR